jgi:O-antigen/teichoic acid export membrane protein
VVTGSPSASLKQKLWQVVPTAGVFGAAGLGMMLLQIVGLRLLPAHELGLVVLTYGISSVTSTAVGMGIPQLVARTAVADGSLTHRQAFLVLSSGIALVPSVLISSVAVFSSPLRTFGPFGVALLTLLTTSAHVQILESSFRRATGAVKSGAFVQQGALLLASLLLLPFTIFGSALRAIDVLLVILAAQCLLLCYSVGFKPRQITLQHEWRWVTSWIGQHFDLLRAMWITATIGMGFRWSDRFTLALVLSLSDLAEYQSIYLLTATYDVLALGAGYILLPQYARAAGAALPNSHRLVLLLAILSTTITSVLTIVVGERMFLLPWRNGSTLITLGFLMIVGTLKLLYADISSAVGGTASSQSIGRFGALLFASLVFGTLTTAALGSLWGLPGAAAGAAMTWGLRVGAAHAVAR